MLRPLLDALKVARAIKSPYIPAPSEPPNLSVGPRGSDNLQLHPLTVEAWLGQGARQFIFQGFVGWAHIRRSGFM